MSMTTLGNARKLATFENDTFCSRRTFLTASGGAVAGAALPGRSFAVPDALSVQKQRVKIGQIGVCHEHAAGKIDTLKNFRTYLKLSGSLTTGVQRRPNLQEMTLNRIKG